MQTEESVKIVKRFFEAIYALKARGDIRGKQTFTAKYKINRWNFNTLEKEPERDIMQMAWLAILVNDFGVSSQWLLTGNGEMFSKQK
ncbi:MAG: hypothetical protein RSF40_11850 [Oscillospiraceae bacterium]